MSAIGPGDLCVVVRSVHPENIGIICQVDSAVNPGDEVWVDGQRLKCAKWGKEALLLVWSKGRPFSVSTRHKGQKVRTNHRKCRAALFSPARLRKLDFDTGTDEMIIRVGRPIHETGKVPVYIYKEVT